MKITITNKFDWNNNYPIFLSENYLKTESDEYGWIIGYVDNKIEIVLPFFIYSKLLFRFLRVTNQTYFLHQELQEKNEQEFLDKAIEAVKELNIDLVMQPTTNVVFDKVPTNSTYAPFGSYRVDLTQDEETLWKNLHSKHRNVVRNAEKKGIQVTENSYDITELYDLVHNTFMRSSMGFMSQEKFQQQIKNLGTNVRVFIAKTSNGEIQGCAIIPYSLYGGYYLHGGSISKPLTGAMNYLQWKVMLSLKESGVLSYDFVGARVNVQKGSKLEGIQKFKARFGAEFHSGYLWKQPIKPYKAKLFELIYKLLKKSEGDIIDQERHKLNV